MHKSGVLEISDINGENSVVLDTPGNTAVIALNGQPSFSNVPTAAQIDLTNSQLPPPDNSQEEEEAVEVEEDADAEEEDASLCSFSALASAAAAAAAASFFLLALHPIFLAVDGVVL